LRFTQSRSSYLVPHDIQSRVLTTKTANECHCYRLPVFLWLAQSRNPSCPDQRGLSPGPLFFHLSRSHRALLQHARYAHVRSTKIDPPHGNPTDISNPKLIVIVGCCGLASNLVGLLLFHGELALFSHFKPYPLMPGFVSQSMATLTRMITRTVPSPTPRPLREKVPYSTLQLTPNHMKGARPVVRRALCPLDPLPNRMMTWACMVIQ
jgi:hypothetical protein